MQTVKMKYTGMASPIEIRDLKTYYFLTMNRNQYYDVPQYIADMFKGNMHFFFNECEHIDKLCEKYPNKRFAFHRWGALGDILQLVPVAKYIKRTFGCSITLITSPIFQTTFNKTTDAFDEVLHITEFDRYQFDRVIFLEGVLEQDHAPSNRESKIHRIKLYEEFFGIKIDRYDFSLNLEE